MVLLLWEINQDIYLLIANLINYSYLPGQLMGGA